MKNELVLYGLAKGDTEQWKEQVLYTNAKNIKTLDKIKLLASNDGFHSFRVAEIDLNEKPDFIKSIN